jgi:hypothetical protein
LTMSCSAPRFFCPEGLEARLLLIVALAPRA